MYILGISSFIKNSAACLLKDGKLVAFAEEERFLRIKGAHDCFPAGAINYCLTQEKINLSDVKKIAIGWDCRKYRFSMPIFFAKSWFKHGLRNPSSNKLAVLNDLLRYNPKIFYNQLKIELAKVGKTERIPKIEFVPHHLAHAASTFYASGFDKASILVIDGSGEERATSQFIGNGLDIIERSHINIPDSLGWFYAAITSYLGFTPYRQEGQVMGLAAYGKPDNNYIEKLRKLIRKKNEAAYSVDPSYTLLGNHSFSRHYSDKLVKFLGEPRFFNDPLTQRHKDIAFAAQFLLEETILSLVKKALENTDNKKLCLAGGVFLNCKMNGEIALSKLAEDIFIQPISNDAGACLGAAMLVAKDEGFDPRFKMEHVYWGPAFSENDVKEKLDQAGINYSRPKDIEKKVSEFIARGKIVAWFKGRMEAGPRALGARSILANPTLKDSKDYVNKKVKHRQTWRPFCPSMTEEVAPEFLTGLSKSQDEARFMIVAYPVYDEKSKEIPAVVHIDKTTRPQIVKKSINENYYRIIKNVGEATGTPIVLNTSFNVRGEPIICNPEQAIRCFASTGLDAMAIEGFWIEKKQF